MDYFVLMVTQFTQKWWTSLIVRNGRLGNWSLAELIRTLCASLTPVDTVHWKVLTRWKALPIRTDWFSPDRIIQPGWRRRSRELLIWIMSREICFLVMGMTSSTFQQAPRQLITPTFSKWDGASVTCQVSRQTMQAMLIDYLQIVKSFNSSLWTCTYIFM